MFLNKKIICTTLVLLLMIFNTNANEKLSAGMKAPDFTLVDQDNIKRTLSDFQGEWVVLYFYPKDDTPGCTTEACSFRDNIEIINNLNTNILGVSVDSQESHKEFSEKYSLPFPILADINGEVAKKYDSYGSFVGFKYASRHTFIINPSGKIHKIYKKVNPSKHASEIIEELKNNI
jgi:peroxiredoxin Q/BCP|tara:strand:+ start:1556 stop:2083 length:528 start_codon:yes stop_codon:yes gene_type:complete